VRDKHSSPCLGHPKENCLTKKKGKKNRPKPEKEKKKESSSTRQAVEQARFLN